MKKNYVVFFLQNHLSELLSNINRWGKIFETEEEDRTNKKHRRHRKEVIVYADKIRKICFLFTFSLDKSTDGHAVYLSRRF